MYRYMFEDRFSDLSRRGRPTFVTRVCACGYSTKTRVPSDHVAGGRSSSTIATLPRAVRRLFRRPATTVVVVARRRDVRRTVVDCGGSLDGGGRSLCGQRRWRRSRFRTERRSGRRRPETAAVGGERARETPHEQPERGVRPAPGRGARGRRRPQAVQIRNAPDGPDVHRRLARSARRTAARDRGDRSTVFPVATGAPVSRRPRSVCFSFVRIYALFTYRFFFYSSGKRVKRKRGRTL